MVKNISLAGINLSNVPPIELDFLKDILKLLDAEVEKILQEWKSYEDDREKAYREHPGEEEYYLPDGEDYFKDRCESVIALGYVAIQEYLTYLHARFKKSTASKPDETHRLLGPEIKSGITLAQAINAGANYFKHHEATVFDSTKSVFQQLGIKIDIPEIEHPILTLLGEITGMSEPIFSPVIPDIAAWYKTLSRLKKGIKG